MSVKIKKSLVFAIDCFIVFISYVIAKTMFVGHSIFNTEVSDAVFNDLLIIMVVYIIIYLIFQVNNYSWKLISVYEALILMLNNFIVLSILLILSNYDVFVRFTKAQLFVGFLLSTILSESVRFIYRSSKVMKYKVVKAKNSSKRVLIYGAGKAGQMLLREVVQNEIYDMNIIGFIDDNVEKKHQILSGYHVLGDGSKLNELIEKYNINKVIVAMPSAQQSQKAEVLQRVVDSKVENIKVLTDTIISSPQSMHRSLRNVEIKDLLNREEITFDDDQIRDILLGKKVLVTGAGGSIGSELVRQIIQHKPVEIVLVDINETGLYQIEQEINIGKRLGKIDESVEVAALVASIRDKERMNTVFKKYTPEIIFHAAAHKHVPLMETSPKEAIKNNIFGTKILIDLSIEYNVQKFVNISTDKAVNPTNVMGATKRYIEMMLQNANNNQSNTIFCAVRFGNVLGSNGSVIPLFKSQIENGGPVTVTDPEMVRYFMTIPEAVSLVLQAATYAKGGEIFVLDMGKPVKIDDLAKNLIRLSGLELGKDIDIEYVGLRPGEKLYEELLMAEEGLRKTDNNLIYIANPIHYDDCYIQECFDILTESLSCENPYEVKCKLAQVVTTFKMEGKSHV